MLLLYHLFHKMKLDNSQEKNLESFTESFFDK